MYSEEKYNKDYAKFILDMLSGEMNRSRDWPLRLLGFTSAFHFAVIAGILVSKITFMTTARLTLSFFFVLLFLWSVYCFWKCHTNYLKARNAQVTLENQIGLADMDVLPPAWLEVRKVSGFTALWGWGLHVFIALGFCLATLGVVWFRVTQ